MSPELDTVLAPLADRLPELENLYRDLHRHPELSYAETRTAAELAAGATAAGYEVTTGVGGTGVVARLRNGDGPTVLLRADMDALPVEEATGLDYASTVTAPDRDGNTVPVMHACGHDMHVTCLLGALQLLAGASDTWSGTVLGVFQPAEEVGSGAQAMIDDGLFDRFGRPDVVLGQHVGPFPAGMVGWRGGPAFAAADALRVTFYGRGGHGSRPEVAIDPVVMAASAVVRLQTVVSREIAGDQTAVVTVGSLQAGTKENIIPDEAVMQMTVRSYVPEVRDRVLAAVRRIIAAEAQASGAEREPDIEVLESFPAVTNDDDATRRAASAIAGAVGQKRVFEAPAVTGSEDVGVFGTASGAPVAYWLFGGTDPATFAEARKAGRVDQEVPSNHQSRFAPVIQPTLTTGVHALTAAALDWLRPTD